MKQLYTLAALVALSTGCIIGDIQRLEDSSGTLTPVVGAQVYFRECPTCAWKAMDPSDSSGYYVWDAYATGNGAYLPAPGYDAYEFLAINQGTGLPNVWYHKPEWMLYTSTNEYYTLVPTIYSVDQTDPSFSADDLEDGDGDNVYDALERYIYGTDDTLYDTDDDGLSDQAEIYGLYDVDYPALGANPRHKDLFFEVDYKEYTAGSTTYPGFPTPDIYAFIQSVYADLEISNPDGVDGVSLHLVKDEEIPDSIVLPGGNCREENPNINLQSPGSLGAEERYSRGMRFMYLCGGGTYGQAATPWKYCDGGWDCGTMTSVNVSWDDDETNDYGFSYNSGKIGYNVRMFVHEVGHSLGLNHHGGNDGINHTFNYPSVMDYGINSRGLWGSKEWCKYLGDLESGCVEGFYSYGLLPDLDEFTVSETQPLGIVSVPWIAYAPLNDGTEFTVNSSGDVDWNQDGDYNDTSVQQYLRSKWTYANDYPTDNLIKIRDYDDVEAIEAYGLKEGIPTYVENYDIWAGHYLSAKRLRDGDARPPDYYAPHGYRPGEGQGGLQGGESDDFGGESEDALCDIEAVEVPMSVDTTPPEQRKLPSVDRDTLAKFLRVKKGKVADILKRLNVTRSAAIRFASRLFDQDEYVDPEVKRAKLEEAISRLQDRKDIEVELVDCEGPSLSDLRDLIAGKVDAKRDRESTRDWVRSQRKFHLCR